ncbi:TIGR02710 family CRISPR-associated CARF protein [Cyanobium sp. FGCU-6]|nr:TIGR02710 family CRISPR-associated CARF protein [Cyanobium sp. FGCU6]
MTHILLVTVGGSPDPIIFAVQALRREQPEQPLEVVFICSVAPCPKPSVEQVTGEGFPCLHYLPDGRQEVGANLLVQLGISDFNPQRHLIGIPDPDDLADAFQRIRDHILQLRSNRFQERIRGDYTGGTKSMSAALAMACVQLGLDVGVVSGPRTNLEKIDQSESTRLMEIAPLHATSQLHAQLLPVLSLQNYGEAAQLVQRFLQAQAQRISVETADQAKLLQAICETLERWDQFQWEEALAAAEALPPEALPPDLLAWWQRVVQARGCMDGVPPEDGITGYELVQDLLLSAERRGRRGRYDDAVSRLYRALELLAQTYVSLELKLSPESRWERDHCFLLDGTQVTAAGDGVTALYNWLERRGDAGLGGIFKRRKGQFFRLLKARNRSLLAHGFNPLTEAEWTALQRDISYFVNEILDQPGFQQGPPPHQLPGRKLLALPVCQQLFGSETQPVLTRIGAPSVAGP